MRWQWKLMVSTTYSGFGGSLAKRVPSFRVRSLGSSGSLSVSLHSIGSSGFTDGVLWLLELLGSGAAGLPEAFCSWRLLRGGASGCACCGCGVCCWGETANSFNCAANMSKSYMMIDAGGVVFAFVSYFSFSVFFSCSVTERGMKDIWTIDLSIVLFFKFVFIHYWNIGSTALGSC